MPSAPNIDGLPLSLQIFVSICFGLATLFVAAKGYLRKDKPDGAAILTAEPNGPIQQLQSAVIGDMGAIRHLSDVCIQLISKIEENTDAHRESAHWIRNKYELDREVCARLRELKEVMERQGRA